MIRIRRIDGLPHSAEPLLRFGYVANRRHPGLPPRSRRARRRARRSDRSWRSSSGGRLRPHRSASAAVLDRQPTAVDHLANGDPVFLDTLDDRQRPEGRGLDERAIDLMASVCRVCPSNRPLSRTSTRTVRLPCSSPEPEARAPRLLPAAARPACGTADPASCRTYRGTSDSRTEKDVPHRPTGGLDP